MFEIEVLLTEDELALQFVSALERRTLPEKFFYCSPLSVRAWLDLCQDTHPYKNYSRSQQLISSYADEIASCSRGVPLEVVSLGAGQADKDSLLLRALRENGCTICYRPVDSSQTLLEMALTRAAEAGLSARGLKADLEDPKTAAALAASATEPRLYLVLGNTLGALDPPRFLETLRELSRPQDRLLLDGEIFRARETMAGYDNPANRRFAFAPLRSVGLEEGRDGQLVFELGTDPRLEGLHFVSKSFQASRRLEIALAGRRIKLEAGERIDMSRSCKYTRTAFLQMVRDRGGLHPLREYLSDDGGFLMVYARPAAT